MPYAVVAERQGLSVFNRVASASDALNLAVERRRAGAHAVYVRDEAWALVPAVVLEAAVARDRDQVSLSPTSTRSTAKDGEMSVRVPGSSEPAPQRTGRVRVFKAAAAQRSRF